MRSATALFNSIPRNYRRAVGAVLAFGELIGFVVFMLGYIVEPLYPDLTAEYMSMPYLVGSTTVEEGRRSEDTDLAGERKVHLYQVRFRNRTNQQIENVEVVVHGFREVDGVGVRSSSSRIEVASESITDISMVGRDGVLLDGLRSIPPRADVTVQILGTMSPRFFGSVTDVSASADDIRVTRTNQLSGLPVVLSRHGATLSGVLVLLFIYLGIRRLTSRDKERS